jgi:protein disulfide-isomerase A6
MKLHIYALLAAVLAFTAQSKLFERDHHITMVDDFSEFQIKLHLSDYVNAFLFYSEESDRSKIFAPMFTEFSQISHEYMKSYAINCEDIVDDAAKVSMLPVCKAENLEYLPAIIFFEPPATRINPYTKKLMSPIEHQYQGDGTAASLFAFGRKHMPAFRKVIESKEALDKFLANEKIPGKVILFTNKPETTALYKALTSEYRGKLLVK